MQAMTTLGQVAERVDAMSKNCTDHHVKINDISFDDMDSMKISNEIHSLKPLAQQSIANRLGIPIQYLRKCPPEVQAFNLNHWIKKEKNDQLFVRMDGAEVRAVFTPKYRPIDNFEVLERLDSLGYPPETPVQSHLDHEFMNVSIPDGRQTFSLKGDKMTPGVSVSNSEVGLACLSIAAFFLRLICTNGMVSSTEVKASYKHTSLKVFKEFPEALERVGQELGKKKDQFKISVESKVDHPLSTIDRFNRQFQLNETERHAVEWGWYREEGDSMFNVVNAYTRGAQFEELSAEASFKLQKVGGMILGMVKN